MSSYYSRRTSRTRALQSVTLNTFYDTAPSTRTMFCSKRQRTINNTVLWDLLLKQQRSVATLYSRPATAEDTQPNETEQGHGCSQSEQMNVNQQELSPYTDIDTWERKGKMRAYTKHMVLGRWRYKEPCLGIWIGHIFVWFKNNPIYVQCNWYWNIYLKISVLNLSPVWIKDVVLNVY